MCVGYISDIFIYFSYMLPCHDRGTHQAFLFGGVWLNSVLCVHWLVFVSYFLGGFFNFRGLCAFLGLFPVLFHFFRNEIWFWCFTWVLLSWLGSMVSIYFCVLMMYTWSYPCVVFLAYMLMSAKSLKLRNDFLLDFSLILYEYYVIIVSY